MKLCVILLISCFSVAAPLAMQDMITALKNGDASALSACFDSQVDITIDGTAKNYTKKSAYNKIKQLFDELKVKDFAVIHKSESNGSQYFIGNLKGLQDSYRVTIYVKTKNNQQLIQEIKFER